MIRSADSYGNVLFDLNIPAGAISDSKKLLAENPELAGALSNPAVTCSEKHRIIERLFPDEVKNFLKVLCDNGRMGDIHLVGEVYEACRLESENILRAELTYANRLSPEQIEALKQKIMKKYGKAGVNLTVKRDASLIGGFVLRVGDEEYDRSVKGRLSRLYRQLAWR